MVPASREPTGEDALRAAVRTRLRGLVVDVAPVFGFTLGLAATRRLAVALAVAVGAAVAVGVFRLVRREPVRRTLGVLGLVCFGGALAGSTGQAANFFLPMLVVHCVMAVVSPVLLVLGWPPLGIAVGLATGERTRWRRCAVRRRAFTLGNLALYAAHLVVLSVQLPLFLSGRAVALGSVDMLGHLVTILGALLAWLIYRRVLGKHRCAVPASAAAEEFPRPERTSS